MGISTALIGFVPTYAVTGLAAAVMLFLLRLIQGLCLGGEYRGAITESVQAPCATGPDARARLEAVWRRKHASSAEVVLA